MQVVEIQPDCLGLYCGRTLEIINGTEIHGDCGVSCTFGNFSKYLKEGYVVIGHD